MIIVCPECSTTFNINADRIPENGTKVRCARCKHVFLAQKEADPENSEAMTVEDTTLATMENEDTDTKSSDFNYDKFQELDSTPPAEPVSNEEILAEAIAELKRAEAAKAAAENPTATDENADSKYQPADPEFPEKPATKKKGGPIASIIRILLLLIMAIIIIGGVFVYINGTEQLNQTIQQLIGQQNDRPVQTGQITLTELEGKFILNKQAGELFLIRGVAVNDYHEPRADIQVKGIVFDPNGKPLRQKTVFCGNAIDDKDLLSLSFAELEKSMGNQFGNSQSNMKVNSKQKIPFDIIFKDLPNNLSEFSVKVTSSTAVN